MPTPIKMKSGGTAFILQNGESCGPGEVCFLAGEWEQVKRHARALESDPEGHRAFWESLVEAKRTLPGFIFRLEQPKTPPAPFPETERGALARKCCAAILADLEAKGFGKKTLQR